jgi:arylsulfatase A-like enzyme
MARRPPNILFFLPDQHRPDWLGSNPDLPLRTPNLDGLARRGVRFTQAFCPSPLCAPSRAALASGKSYNRCRVPNNGFDYPLDQPTYYQALHDRGYRVAGVGKFDLHKATLDWSLDGTRLIREWGFSEGIDNEGKLDGSNSYRRKGGPMGPYLAFLQRHGWADVYVQEHTHRKQYVDAYTTALPDEVYCDNWVAENGLSFLRAFPSDRPWHLVINFAGPHNPMDVTASMRQRWETVDLPLPHRNDHPDREGLLRNRQNYAAMIENIDRHVGHYLDLVAERGELEDTLVVYSSDHGEMLGDHGRWGKSTWRTASAGIPLIVAGPGVRQGLLSDALVSLHDLAATFLEYARAQPLPDMDAISLCALLSGRRVSHREVVTSGLDDWRMAFDGQHKLVIRIGQPPLLYDLAADPLEDLDIAPQEPHIVARLLSTIEREWAAAA